MFLNFVCLIIMSWADNWAKVTTQWKHRRGTAQLAQKRIGAQAGAPMQQLAQPDPAWAERFE